MIKKSDAGKLLTSIIGFYLKNYNVEASGKDGLKLNRRTFTAAQFEKHFTDKTNLKNLETDIGESEMSSLYEFIKQSNKAVSNYDQAKQYLAQKTYGKLGDKLHKEARNRVVRDASESIQGHDYNMTPLRPIMDITSGSKVMVNVESNQVDHRVSFKAWNDYARTRTSNIRNDLLASMIPAKVEYNPYKPEDFRYKDINGQKDILHVNAHRPPRWRKLEKEYKNPKLPKHFVQLMKHLFPNEECRKYIYHWMNFMMTSRNHCYLLLHGEQGIGKNSFATILEKLVGVENYSYIGPGFWDVRFNDELKFKRCAFFDETVINKDNIITIRSQTNKYLSIEEKGLPTIMLENHCSYVIANNLDKVNLILYDDRRYSVPVLTHEPIKTALGQEWLDEFYDLVEESEDFIGNIGHWILQNGDTGDYNEKQPYLSDTFYDMVDKSLSDWQAVIINEIESKRHFEYDLNVIKHDNKLNVGRTKIQTFLDTHKDREGSPYGSLKQGKRGERIIVPSPKYLPESDTNFDDSNDVELSQSDFDDMEF